LGEAFFWKFILKKMFLHDILVIIFSERVLLSSTAQKNYG
jgi:hypothetical protein